MAHIIRNFKTHVLSTIMRLAGNLNSITSLCSGKWSVPLSLFKLHIFWGRNSQDSSERWKWKLESTKLWWYFLAVEKPCVCSSDWLRRKAAVLIWQCENVNQSVVEGCLPLTHKKLGNLTTTATWRTTPSKKKMNSNFTIESSNCLDLYSTPLAQKHAQATCKK